MWDPEHSHTKASVEKTLTFTRALELSQGLETASKHAKELAQVRVPEAASSLGSRVAIQKDGNEREAVLRDSNEVSVFRVVNRAIYVVSAVSVMQSVTNVAKLVTYKKPVIASLEESLTIVIRFIRKLQRRRYIAWKKLLTRVARKPVVKRNYSR